MPLICIASPKGGVGKTTIAANLADALRREGRRVIALDLDPQNALRLHFGVPLGDHAGFAAQLPNRPDWQGCLRQTAAGVALLPHGTLDLPGTLALAAALGRDPALLAGPVRAMLADPAVLVVADLPPGASEALHLMAPLADLVVTLLLADAAGAALVPELDSGRFLGGTLAGLGPRRSRVLLNQVDPASRLSRSMAEALARHLGPRLLGAIAREEAVAEALAAQHLLLDLSPASAAAFDLRQVAQAIVAALPRPMEPAAAWWAR